jgi:hypothetical protein
MGTFNLKDGIFFPIASILPRASHGFFPAFDLKDYPKKGFIP